jgi:hypothetical protein
LVSATHKDIPEAISNLVAKMLLVGWTNGMSEQRTASGGMDEWDARTVPETQDRILAARCDPNGLPLDAGKP